MKIKAIVYEAPLAYTYIELRDNPGMCNAVAYQL